MVQIFNIDRDYPVLLQYIEFYLDGKVADPISIGKAQFVYVQTNEVVYDNLTKGKQSAGLYLLSTPGTLSEKPKVGFYQCVVHDVKFKNRPLIKKYYGDIFKISPSAGELIDEGAPWIIEAEATNKYRNINRNSLNSLIFTDRPKTFFFEEDTELYYNEADYSTYIPDADVYIFPAKGVWTNSGLGQNIISTYKNKGLVSVSVPVTYVDTNYISSGFNDLVFNTLSGLNALQFSTTGDLIYSQEGKAVYSFWNNQHRDAYLNIVKTYGSGVDFITYRNFEPFSEYLNLSNPDPMLDFGAYGWSGEKQWSDNDWNYGLFKFINSGLSTDLYDNRNNWFLKNQRLQESPASVILGQLTQDTTWEEGEIWNYIQRINSLKNQKTFIATAYKRNATAEDIKLGKAIALMTDSYFSPGEANFSLFQNYQNSQYSKYNIGDPIGPPIKVGSTIKRGFSNGSVEIDDVGYMDSANVRITVGSFEVADITISLPTTFLSMMPQEARLFSEFDINELELLAVADYWTIDSEKAYNEVSDRDQLISWLELTNPDILIGANLYYTDWPTARWEAEYNSGLTTMGAHFYTRLVGQPYDSVAYRIFWSDYINSTNFSFYVISETDTNIPVGHVQWLTQTFPNKHFIFKTQRTDFPHSQLMIDGLTVSEIQATQLAGKYIWIDNVDDAIALDAGFSKYGIDKFEAQYRISGVLTDSWAGPNIDQAWMNTQEFLKVSAVHAPKRISTITPDPVLTGVVMYSGTWPDGTYEMGYFGQTYDWYNVPGNVPGGVAYYGTRPRVRRVAEYSMGYVYGLIAGFNFNGRAEYRLNKSVEWLRDVEQVFKDPHPTSNPTPGSFRTGLMCDGSFVSWIYRPNQTVPNDTYNRFIESAPTYRNEAASNWFASGRVLRFLSQYYAYLINVSGLTHPIPEVLTPIQIAVNNIVNKGSNFALPDSSTDPEWGYIDPQTGQGDIQPNINYHASALYGLVCAYNAKAAYLIDPDNTITSGILTNHPGVFFETNGTNTSTASNSIDGNSGTVATWTNTTAGNTFTVGLDLSKGNETVVYKYSITTDSANAPNSWDLYATNHIDGQNAPIEKWQIIDYRTDEVLNSSATNEFIIQNPALFRTYKLVFTGFDSSTTNIADIQFTTATKSDALLLKNIEYLTREILGTQDKDPQSALFGTFYQSDAGRTEVKNGQVFYHDSRTNYHIIILHSLIYAYTAITNEALKHSLRFAIRLGVDVLIRQLEPNGMLRNYVATTTGEAPNSLNITIKDADTSTPALLGLLGMIMKDEFGVFTIDEINKLKILMKATASPLEPAVTVYFEACTSYKAYYDSVFTTNNNILYFKVD